MQIVFAIILHQLLHARLVKTDKVVPTTHGFLYSFLKKQVMQNNYSSSCYLLNIHSPSDSLRRVLQPTLGK